MPYVAQVSESLFEQYRNCFLRTSWSIYTLAVKGYCRQEARSKQNWAEILQKYKSNPYARRHTPWTDK